MTKNEIINKLEALKDKPMQYGSKLWKLKNYSCDDVQERCYMHTHQGKTFDRPYDSVKDFLEQLEPITESSITKLNLKPIMPEHTNENQLSSIVGDSSDAPKTFSDLRAILMDNIAKLQNKKIDVSTAKEICNHAQAVVNIVKLEMDFIKTKGKIK